MALQLENSAHSFIRAHLSESVHPCITCSFQAEGVVLLHMLIQHAPQIPVLFIDTGYHFVEVLRYRDQIARDWNLNLQNLSPRQTVAQQEASFGALYVTAPDRCCAARKVEPLFAELERHDSWFSGLRREQSKSRTSLQATDVFVLPSGKRLRKLSPLAEWSTRDVWAYAERHEIPLLALYDEGYSSIGCQPCTSLPSDAANPRSGRWSGRKVECGIHIQPIVVEERRQDGEAER